MQATDKRPYERGGIVYTLNTGTDWTRTSPVIVGCINDLIDGMTYMLSKHSKVLVFQGVFFLSNPSADNADLASMRKAFTRHLKQVHKLANVQFGFSLEVCPDTGRHHYHVVAMIDGNRFKSGWKFHQWLSRYWVSLGHPKPHYVKGGAHVVKRADQLSQQLAIYHLSYLAKVRSKVNLPKGVKVYSISGQKLRPQEDTQLAKRGRPIRETWEQVSLRLGKLLAPVFEMAEKLRRARQRWSFIMLLNRRKAKQEPIYAPQTTRLSEAIRWANHVMKTPHTPKLKAVGAVAGALNVPMRPT